ncbi:hypothetical protein K3495_g3229 [Podosphaera aphanis]|nr:hypothetical protein K3495_g3229 [Podosphaera aphanis]
MPTIEEKHFHIISDENSRHKTAMSWILDPEEIDPHTEKFSAATEAYHIFYPHEVVFRKLVHKRAQKQRNRTMSECGTLTKKFVSYKKICTYFSIHSMPKMLWSVLVSITENRKENRLKI